jgi:hypothetical protein
LHVGALGKKWMMTPARIDCDYERSWLTTSLARGGRSLGRLQPTKF